MLNKFPNSDPDTQQIPYFPSQLFDTFPNSDLDHFHVPLQAFSRILLIQSDFPAPTLMKFLRGPDSCQFLPGKTPNLALDVKQTLHWRNTILILLFGYLRNSDQTFVELKAEQLWFNPE